MHRYNSGMLALRSRLSIPVIGPGLVACHIASMLGRRFSVVSLFSRWADNMRRNLVGYELDHKVASYRSLTDVVPDIRRLMGGKEHLFRRSRSCADWQSTKTGRT